MTFFTFCVLRLKIIIFVTIKNGHSYGWDRISVSEIAGYPGSDFHIRRRQAREAYKGFTGTIFTPAYFSLDRAYFMFNENTGKKKI